MESVLAQGHSTPSSSSVNSRAWRVLAWAGIVLQAAALVFVLSSQQWGGAWILAGFLALSVVFMLMQDRLPSLLSLLVVLAALHNAGGWAWEWYKQLAGFDEFAHAFSAFAVVSACSYVAWTRGWVNAAPGSGKFVLLATAAGFGLGVAWEIFESTFLSLAPVDTVVDLVLDTIGAAIAGAFAGWVIRKQGASRAP
jgi:hypothetical protein